jgi:hypothetical protein
MRGAIVGENLCAKDLAVLNGRPILDGLDLLYKILVARG